MPYQRNLSIASAGTAGVRVTFCSTSYSGTFSCTSYPVFSQTTTEGTNRYAVNSALKQLSPAGSYAAANNPSVSYSSTTGTALVTFTYGNTYSDTLQEYEAGGSPRRYRYILHTSGHTPATAYTSLVSASTAVVMFGSVDVRVASTASASFISVCSDTLEGTVGGGL